MRSLPCNLTFRKCVVMQLACCSVLCCNFRVAVRGAAICVLQCGVLQPACCSLLCKLFLSLSISVLRSLLRVFSLTNTYTNRDTHTPSRSLAHSLCNAHPPTQSPARPHEHTHSLFSKKHEVSPLLAAATRGRDKRTAFSSLNEYIKYVLSLKWIYMWTCTYTPIFRRKCLKENLYITFESGSEERPRLGNGSCVLTLYSKLATPTNMEPTKKCDVTSWGAPPNNPNMVITPFVSTKKKKIHLNSAIIR